MDEELAQLHGSDATAFLEALKFPEDRQRLYSSKNSSLELSLDVARLWSGKLYEVQAEWLRDLVTELQPERVLDIGCEQGILTKVISEAVPTAEVRAVDRCVEAVELAIEYSRTWDSPAPAFHLYDLRDPWHAEWAGGTMDIVHASRSMLGEVILPSAELPRGMLPGELEPSSDWLREARVMAGRIAAATRPGGLFVSLDRTDQSGALRWARVLAENGFQLDQKRTRMFGAAEPGAPDLRLPCLVFEMLDGSAAPEPTPLEVVDALVSAPEGQGTWTGAEAEALALHARSGARMAAWDWAAGRNRAEVWISADGLVVESRLSVESNPTVWVHPVGTSEAVVSRLERELVALLGGLPPQAP